MSKVSDKMQQTGDKMRNIAVRNNMLAVQVGLETYAKEHDGKYPTVVDEAFKASFRKPNSVNLDGPVNPFTNKAEWPTVGGGAASLEAAKNSPPAQLKPGEIYYCPIAGGESYAIMGGSQEGTPIMNSITGKPFTLTKGLLSKLLRH
jgi:hypothetical protein